PPQPAPGDGEFAPITILPSTTFAPVNWELQIQHWMQELFRNEREAQLLGEEGDPQFAEKLTALMVEYANRVVAPLLPQIETDCSFAEENAPKTVAFARQVDLLTPQLNVISETILGSVGKGIENCFQETIEPCLDYSDTEQMAEAGRFARQAVLLGGDGDVFNPYNPEYACPEITGTLTWTRVEDEQTENSTWHQEESATFRLRFQQIPDGGIDAGSSFSYESTGTRTIVSRRCGDEGGTDTFTRSWTGSGSGSFPPPWPGASGTNMYLHRESDSHFSLSNFWIPTREVHTYETCRGESKVQGDSYTEDRRPTPRCYTQVDNAERNMVGVLKEENGMSFIDFACSTSRTLFGRTTVETVSGRLFVPTQG
ncbi:MAG TPA: hypothetical protein VM386_00565, partial [Acidimicrobiales bacterium]|nr:hypothetical protein [Acidimicrobiales bacterium]